MEIYKKKGGIPIKKVTNEAKNVDFSAQNFVYRYFCRNFAGRNCASNKAQNETTGQRGLETSKQHVAEVPDFIVNLDTRGVVMPRR